MLSATKLTTGYRKGKRLFTVNQNLDFTLQSGNLICLLGPNGIGKSTLLKTLSGLIPPLSGEVVLNKHKLEGTSAIALAKEVALVLTEPLNLGNMDVYTFVSMGRTPHNNFLGQLSSQDKHEIATALELTGMTGFSHRLFMELSDGEKQKVQIARALCQSPKILILDEPTSFLDLPGRIDILSMLRDLAHTKGLLVLASTHELDLALKISDHILVLDKKQNLHVGCPEDLLLSDTLQNTFEGKGFYFQPESGEIQLNKNIKSNVYLEASSKYYNWTLKALNRIGFTTGDGKSLDIKIVVRIIEEKPQWIVTIHEKESICKNISHVCEILKKEVFL